MAEDTGPQPKGQDHSWMGGQSHRRKVRIAAKGSELQPRHQNHSQWGLLPDARLHDESCMLQYLPVRPDPFPANDKRRRRTEKGSWDGGETCVRVRMGGGTGPAKKGMEKRKAEETCSQRKPGS